MEYFTPELYLRSNSLDDDIADQAQEDWEVALRAYREHIAKLPKRLPSQIRELALGKSHHDYEVVEYSQKVTQTPTSDQRFGVHAEISRAVFVVTLKKQDDLELLIYFITRDVEIRPSVNEWPLTEAGEPLWLYDEFYAESDRDRDHGYTHCILLSNGVELTIPFCDVMLIPVEVASNVRS